MRRIIVIDIGRDDALRRVIVLKSSLEAKDAELQVVQRATKKLQPEPDVVLRQMGHSTDKISRLNSAISPVGEMLVTSADAQYAWV